MFGKAESSSSVKTSPPTEPPRAQPRKGQMPSLISADLTIVGDLKSDGEIQVDGSVKGDITGTSLVLSEGGKIEGSVIAETARVAGTISGRIEARSVVISRSAKVLGDVVHSSLEIEAGAHIEGSLKRLDSDRGQAKESGPAAKPVAAVSQPVGAPQGKVSAG